MLRPLCRPLFPGLELVAYLSTLCAEQHHQAFAPPVLASQDHWLEPGASNAPPEVFIDVGTWEGSCPAADVHGFPFPRPSPLRRPPVADRLPSQLAGMDAAGSVQVRTQCWSFQANVKPILFHSVTQLKDRTLIPSAFFTALKR